MRRHEPKRSHGDVKFPFTVKWKNNYFLLDFGDSRIQYTALSISITVCSVILALILLFCYVR